MKLTHDRLKQIIAEEIEEGLFDKAVGAVTGAAKGAVSGFKQGGLKGAVAGAQQQGKSEGEKKSLQADYMNLANLTKQMQKQSAKDPKMAEASKQIGYFLRTIQDNLGKLGIQVPATGLSEQGQPSALDKVKQVASAVGNAAYDKMKRTPMAAAADKLRLNVVNMQKTSQDPAQKQALHNVEVEINKIIKMLGSVGQHAWDLKAKQQAAQQPAVQQKPVQENKKLTRDMLSRIIKEELEEIMSKDKNTVKMKLQGQPIELVVKRFGSTNFVTIRDSRSMEEISKYEVSLANPKTGGSPLIDHVSGKDFDPGTEEWRQIQSAMMKLVADPVNEAVLKVSLSSEEREIQRAASDNNMQYPLEIDGKKYIYQQLSSGLKLFNPDEVFLKYWKTSGRSERPMPIQDPQILMKASSMLNKKSPRRR